MKKVICLQRGKLRPGKERILHDLNPGGQTRFSLRQTTEKTVPPSTLPTPFVAWAVVSCSFLNEGPVWQVQGTARMYKGLGADRGHSPQDSPGAGRSLVLGKRKRQPRGRGWWAARKTYLFCFGTGSTPLWLSWNLLRRRGWP